jgi:hypothetical protein
MRQVSDTLVWLGVVLVLAAVVYFVPQFANFVAAVEAQQDRGKVAWHVTASQSDDSPGTP